MYNINSNNVFNTYYNGPHEMKSTSLTAGFTVTVKNIYIPNNETTESTSEEILQPINVIHDNEQ